MPKEDTKAGLEKLLTKALNLLSYRPRSEREIRVRLGKLSDDKQLIGKVIDLCRQDKLLDDLEFAKWWVRQRLTFRPRGNRALVSELIQKGIDRQIISKVLLPKEKEKQQAEKLLSKKNLDKPHAQRLLLSRGFSPDIVFTLIK
jgi:regulatory protein